MLRICFAIFCFFSTCISASNRFEWMDRQIEEDFKSVQKIKIANIVKEHKKISNPNINLFYIKDGELFGPNNNMYRFLLEVLKRYDVPDLAFLYAYCDIIRNPDLVKWNLQIPILSSVKAPNCEGKLIHFIDWYFDPNKKDSGLLGIINEINQNTVDWESKKSILFWRGTTTYSRGRYHLQSLDQFPRGILVKKSLESPEYIDAKFNYVKNPQKQSHFPLAPFASISDHLNYKYQIAMDGETATYPGFQWRLLSNCLCIKQSSDETMWFYGALAPWVHYVPVSKDLENLELVLEYLMMNDAKAKRIANHARLFSEQNLMPEHMYLYAYKVLMKYASKIEYWSL